MLFFVLLGAVVLHRFLQHLSFMFEYIHCRATSPIRFDLVSSKERPHTSEVKLNCGLKNEGEVEEAV